MTTDHLAALEHYRAPGASISVPAGWTDLMLDLHARLVEVSPGFQYMQVQQKWGELRVYATGATAEARDLIHDAELRSRSICEVCGQTGTPHMRRSWHRVMCPVHAAELGYTEVIRD